MNTLCSFWGKNFLSRTRKRAKTHFCEGISVAGVKGTRSEVGEKGKEWMWSVNLQIVREVIHGSLWLFY